MQIRERVRQLIRLERPDGYKHDGSRYYRCPFCNGRRKLEVAAERPVFYCHKCGIGGTLDERRRCAVTGYAPATPRRIEDWPEVLANKFYPLKKEEGVLQKYLTRERRLPSETIKRMRPHKGPSPARVYFPFYELGGTQPVYFVGRSVLPCFPRYWNPALDAFEKRKTQVLWGLHQFSRPVPQVVVCEGIFSACHEPNRVAVLGKTLSDEQTELLKMICTEEIIICLDGDAEHAATIMAAKLVLRVTMKVSVVRLPHGLDPDDVRDLGPWMKKKERFS